MSRGVPLGRQEWARRLYNFAGAGGPTVLQRFRPKLATGLLGDSINLRPEIVFANSVSDWHNVVILAWWPAVFRFVLIERGLNVWT